METKSNSSIFIVEDDVIYQEIVNNELVQLKNVSTEIFNSGLGCLKNLYKKPRIVVLDYNLNAKMNGIQTLTKIKQFDPSIEVIMLTGVESIDIALSSMKHGAYDYVLKNDFAMKRIGHLVEKIKKVNDLKEENLMLKKGKTFFLSGVGIIVAGIIILSKLFPSYFD